MFSLVYTMLLSFTGPPRVGAKHPAWARPMSSNWMALQAKLGSGGRRAAAGEERTGRPAMAKPALKPKGGARKKACKTGEQRRAETAPAILKKKKMKKTKGTEAAPRESGSNGPNGRDSGKDTRSSGTSRQKSKTKETKHTKTQPAAEQGVKKAPGQKRKMSLPVQTQPASAAGHVSKRQKGASSSHASESSSSVKTETKGKGPSAGYGFGAGRGRNPPAAKPAITPATSIVRITAATTNNFTPASLALSKPIPMVELSPKPYRAHESTLTELLALDCEMVGVGSAGTRSALAQIVIVNSREELVYSTFVRPREKVTDFRTRVSGIRPHDFVHALSFQQAQTEVARLMYKRQLVGHALHNDLKALQLSHPKASLRDTSLFPRYRHQNGALSRARKLSELAHEMLGMRIQMGAHSPLEDAIAALRLYKLHAAEWERSLRHPKMSSGGKSKKKRHKQLASFRNERLL